MAAPPTSGKQTTPPTFTDTKGRQWALEVNVLAIKRVQAALGITLSKLFDDRLQPLAELLSDPVRPCDVLFVLCQDQAEKQSVTDEDFGGAAYSGVLHAAAEALVEALLRFQPSAPQAKLREVIDRGRAVEKALTLKASASLDKVMEGFDAEKVAEKIIADLRVKRHPTPEPAAV